MPLSAQGSLSQRLHHNRCNAEANGCPGRECEERDPHGVIPRSALFRRDVFGARIQRTGLAIRSRNLAWFSRIMIPFFGQAGRNGRISTHDFGSFDDKPGIGRAA
jgi:hypothetical protein